MKSESQLLQSVVAAAPLPMLISRVSDGLVLSANHRAAAALGVELEELVGRLTPDFYADPDERVEVLATLEREGSIQDLEIQVRRADGERFWAEATVYPLEVSGEAAICCSFIDTTERRALAAARAEAAAVDRRRAELRVRRAEARAQAIVEALPDLVFVLTREGKFADFTGPPDQPTHVPVSEFLGRHISEVLPPPVANACLDALQRATDTGKVAVAEYELETPTGARFWEARLVPSGEDEVLGLVRNITGQVQARAALAEKNKELLQTQKLQAVGQLAGGIAHDFNNALAVVVGLTTMAIHTLPEDSPMEADLNEVVRAAQRAAGLSQRLLAFARQHVAQPQLVDINNATSALREVLQKVLGAGSEFVMRLDEDPLHVIIDPHQYELVLHNLVANARDAMPDGGRLIIDSGIASLAGFDDVDVVAETTDYAVVTVTDSGTGMDADVLKHLFEPFFTTRPMGQGTGLGLATCYGVIRQAGGRFEVRSAPGQGSTFSIYLPLHDPSALDESSTDRTHGHGHETILLVADEPGVLSLAMRVLRKRGYVVLAAANGEDALRVSVQHGGHIDLLLTDVVMPRMSGRQLAAALRAERATLRVLASTSTPNQYRSDDTFDGLLAKPFTADQLVEAVRDTLDALTPVQA